MSDHYAIHSVFSVKKYDSTIPRTIPSNSVSSSYPNSKSDSSTETDLLEQVLSTLQQHLTRVQFKSIRMMYIATPLLLLATVGLMIGMLWIDFNPRWTLLLATVGVSLLTVSWVGCFSYGFFYCGETVSAFTNVVQEVQLALENSRGGDGSVFLLRDETLLESGGQVQAMPAGGPIRLN